MGTHVAHDEELTATARMVGAPTGCKEETSSSLTQQLKIFDGALVGRTSPNRGAERLGRRRASELFPQRLACVCTAKTEAAYDAV